MNDALPTLLGVLLVAIVASTALLPLLRGAPAQPAEAPISSDPAQAERFRLYRQVLELEFDQQTGKLSREDFEALSAELLAQAGENLRFERATEDNVAAEASPDLEIDTEVEREIAAARKAFAQARREQLEAEEVAS